MKGGGQGAGGGGQGGPSQGGNQCKTLPNSCNNPLLAQHGTGASLKFPKGVGGPGGGGGDAATAGEAISSAIVKYVSIGTSTDFQYPELKMITRTSNSVVS